MRADSDSGDRSLGDGFRVLAPGGSSQRGGLQYEEPRRGSARRRSKGPQPGEQLIVGGFSPRGTNPYRSTRRRSTARAAAPLAVPVALGVTLGVILAVSAGPTKEHVTQGTSGSTSSSTPAPATPTATHSGPAASTAPAGR
ncbi:MAG TPA: hypothetical protein VMU95_30555 [Trebonia sp.]|nr:hypothetical protein [Trebonia sp.]